MLLVKVSSVFTTVLDGYCFSVLMWSLNIVDILAGILMWEVFTLGKQPYELYDNMQVIQKVTKGYRLYRPQLASETIYQIMYSCWHEVCTLVHMSWTNNN